MLRASLCLAFVALLSGCQTSLVRSFEQVNPGMDKHQVLQILGGPTSTTRMHGKDRWMYHFYEDGIRFDKEVHFLDGILVYSGDTYVPPKGKSAKEKDQQVAETEEQIQQKEKEDKEARAKALQDYESQVQGTKEVRYMPDFVEVK